VTTQFAAPEASIADRIVTTGPTYRYRVKALSRTGTLSAAWSSWSASVAAGGDTTAPGVITSPSITGQLGSIFAAWTNPTDDDFAQVNIYRHTSNVVGSAVFVGTVLANNATLYVPAASTTYWFWAATVDRTGNEGAKTAIGSAQALPVGALAQLGTVGAAQIDNGAVSATKLGADAVTTAKVQSGAITPVYAALTTGTVNWTASAAEKDLQTVASVVVTRGKVIIRASFTCDLSPQGSASVVGILRLYRDGSEIINAQTTQQPVATLAAATSFVFSRQWILDFIDDPGAGTYTYKIAFDPGHTADGDIRRRFLSVTPMQG